MSTAPLISTVSQATRFNPDELDPFGQKNADRDDILHAFIDPVQSKKVVELLWFEFKRTGNFKYGEWASIYCYAWWRTQDISHPGRLRSSLAGQRMGKILSQENKDHPAGMFWNALFNGAEAISRGLLNAVHLVPLGKKLMEPVFEKFPRYFFGMPGLMLGKLYTKVPKFPISLGDLDKAQRYFDRVEALNISFLPVYYLFKAELLHLQGKTNEAFTTLKVLEQPYKADSIALRYVYETSKADAASLKNAIISGTYNKLTFDPLLEPVRILSPKSI